MTDKEKLAIWLELLFDMRRASMAFVASLERSIEKMQGLIEADKLDVDPPPEDV